MTKIENFITTNNLDDIFAALTILVLVAIIAYFFVLQYTKLEQLSKDVKSMKNNDDTDTDKDTWDEEKIRRYLKIYKERKDSGESAPLPSLIDRYKLFKAVQGEDFHTRRDILFLILRYKDTQYKDLISETDYATAYWDTMNIVDAIISPDDNRIAVRGARKLLQASILYLWHTYPDSEVTMVNLHKIIMAHDHVRYDDDYDISDTPLDILFGQLEEVDKDDIALCLYKDFKAIRPYDYEDSVFMATDAISDFVYGINNYKPVERLHNNTTNNTINNTVHKKVHEVFECADALIDDIDDELEEDYE